VIENLVPRVAVEFVGSQREWRACQPTTRHELSATPGHHALLLFITFWCQTWYSGPIARPTSLSLAANLSGTTHVSSPTSGWSAGKVLRISTPTNQVEAQIEKL
jgi:hypothetical protein